MTKNQLRQLFFHKNIFILLCALVFLWMSISLLSDSVYDTSALTPHHGLLVKIDSSITRRKNRLFFKEITRELRLTLNNDPNYFTSITTKDFGQIVSKISVGDSLTIFSKKKRYGIFGLKKANYVSHLTRKDEIVVDYETYRQSIAGLFLIPLIGFIIFLCWYYKATMHRYFFQIKTYSWILV